LDIATMHLYLAITLPLLCGVVLALLVVRVFRSHAPWDRLASQKHKPKLRQRIFDEFSVDIATL
jgi:uncharacterized membrane protein affecting hemolysin expression